MARAYPLCLPFVSPCGNAEEKNTIKNADYSARRHTKQGELLVFGWRMVLLYDCVTSAGPQCKEMHDSRAA